MATTTEIDQDSNLEKGTQAGEQAKPDDTRPITVTPDNDNGIPGEPVANKSPEGQSSKEETSEGDAPGEEEDSSNKGQGPAVENL